MFSYQFCELPFLKVLFLIFLISLIFQGANNLNPIPYHAEYFGHKLHMDQNEKLNMFGQPMCLLLMAFQARWLPGLPCLSKTTCLSMIRFTGKKWKETQFYVAAKTGKINAKLCAYSSCFILNFFLFNNNFLAYTYVMIYA